MTEAQQRSVPVVHFTDAEAGAKTFPDSDSRHYNYYKPAGRKQTHYEDMTVEVQPDPRHYLSQGWLYGFSNGVGGYPLNWTALKAWGTDRPEPERFPGSGGKGYDWPALGWHEFRDPNEEWELTLYRYNANVVRQLNGNIENARQSKAFDLWNAAWVRFVERNVGAWMHVDHGLGLYLFANANRRAPTNMHNNAISVNSMHRIRSAQDLALYNLTLSEEIDDFNGTAHLETWNSDPAWQGVREVAEQLTAIGLGAARHLGGADPAADLVAAGAQAASLRGRPGRGQEPLRRHRNRSQPGRPEGARAMTTTSDNPLKKEVPSPFKADNTSSNMCGFTLMNNQVGEVVAQVLATKPNVKVTWLPSMMRVDGQGRFDVIYSEIDEAAGEEPGWFNSAEFEESMSTHYGRMIHEDDRTIMVANPEDAAEALGFDLVARS